MKGSSVGSDCGVRRTSELSTAAFRSHQADSSISTVVDSRDRPKPCQLRPIAGQITPSPSLHLPGRWAPMERYHLRPTSRMGLAAAVGNSKYDQT